MSFSPSGRTAVASSDNSITVIETSRGAESVRQLPRPDGANAPSSGALPLGLAFSGERSFYAAEPSGGLALFDLDGARRRAVDLDQNGVTNSLAGDLALDSERDLLYALDHANSRVAVIATGSRKVIASVPVAPVPLTAALSPDRRRLYVASLVSGPEADSFAVIDVSDPAAPKLEAAIPAGSGRGIAVTAERVFVSGADADAVTIINAKTNAREGEIPIRIPGLEQFRGVMPSGLAFHEPTGWLLVAEAGVNAIGVIDTKERRVLGHIPAAWFPSHVAVRDTTVFVLNARGHGVGPTASAPEGSLQPPILPPQGTLQMFELPSAADLPALTARVLEANGFRPRPVHAAPLPEAVRHVVLIVKGGHTFDAILGDVPHAANGPVMGLPGLARFGARGYADGRGKRLSLKDINVTPNHHEIARRWAISDNFYSRPVSWTHPVERLDLAAVIGHLERHGVSAAGPAADANTPDHLRAESFIRGIEAKYVQGGAEPPRFLALDLPYGRMADPRPGEGYPYGESFVAGNDYALGKVLEYLSGTKLWPHMAVFVTERDTTGGVDHIDAQRTVLLAAGPWVRKNYVSHLNSGYPGLLKTIFRLLGVPPLSLFDAAATDLSDCFAAQPDPAPYKALPVTPRLYDPATGPSELQR